MRGKLPVFQLLVGLALLHPATSALADASQPMTLQRQGSWNLNYDKDGCSLQAAFGTGSDQIGLQMTRFAPSTSFAMTFIGKPLGPGGPGSTITLDFGPDHNPRKIDTADGTVNDLPMKILARQHRLDDVSTDTDKQLPELSAAQEAAVTWLEIKSHGKFYHLELGRMNKPMIAFRHCTDDLVRSWGLAPDVQSTLRSPPRPLSSPNTWLTDGDYPADALSKGKQALINFRLIVDQSGTVTGCTIQRAITGPVFEKVTCDKVMKRARFAPAIDASGKAVTSYYINAVRFVIP